MSERRKRVEMIAELLREGGILVAVFGMLDKFLREEGPSLRWTAGVMGIALCSMALGIIMEERRR